MPGNITEDGYNEFFMLPDNGILIDQKETILLNKQY